MIVYEKKQILILAVAVLMIAGFVVFRYLPLHHREQAINRIRSEQRLIVTENQVRSEQLSSLENQLKDLEKKVGDYDASIPVERPLGPFLQNLSDLMNKYSLADQQMTPGKEIDAGELGCFPLSLHFKGGLAQIFEFCRELQGMDRLVRIEQIKLANDKQFNGEVTMDAKAVVYYRKKGGQG